MASMVVTVISSVAVLVGGLLLVRLRAAQRPPVTGSGEDRMVQRLGEAVRSTAAAVAGGTLAGFGGRRLMRVVGATSDDAASPSVISIARTLPMIPHRFLAPPTHSPVSPSRLPV